VAGCFSERVLPSTLCCWICGSLDTAPWKRRSIDRPVTADDLQITDTRYGLTLALWRCHACGFVFADRRELEALSHLYEALTDPDYIEGRRARAFQMQWLLDLVQRVKPEVQHLLDIGAASGLLVAEARRRGLAAIGVEPSRSLVAHAKRVHGVELLQGFFPHAALAGHRFDAICLVDVIEHVTDPVQMLRDCAAHLTPGGVVVVVTPDVESMTARLMGRRWWHFRLAHVGYFSRRSLGRAAAAARLEPILETRARWFFTVEYVAERVGQYLPIDRLHALARRHPLLKRIYERIVPLNPRDSMVVFLEANAGTRSS
jgi:2-polyprenyl-3-methyl-5-hydroxy-6-metoxy-1,4-benzoquinol methylase